MTQESTVLIYLASPYTHENEEICLQRAEQAAEAAAALKRAGVHVFAPIPHGHIMKKYGLPSGYDEFWKPFCHNMIDRCDGTLVLTLDGYKESVGVSDEVLYTVSIDKPVGFISLDDLLSGRFNKSEFLLGEMK